MSRGQRTLTTLVLCAALAAANFALQTRTDERGAMDLRGVGDERIVATDGYEIICAVYREAEPQTADLEWTETGAAPPHFFTAGTAGFLYRNGMEDDSRIMPVKLGCAFPDEMVIETPDALAE